MSRVGLTVVRPDAESPLSPEFGLAGWVLICDTDGEQRVFERNRLLSGMGVVDILERHGCTDGIFSNIGQGAFEALKPSTFEDGSGQESQRLGSWSG
jgi:predicted Fe-Mo cluster-binding NifX family protein